MKHLTVYTPELHRADLLRSREALPAHHKTGQWAKAYPETVKTWWATARAVATDMVHGVHLSRYVHETEYEHPLAAYQARAALAVHQRAACLAWKETALVCAPVSGFHHAGYDFGGGLCTYNGLIFSLLALREQGMHRPILLLDCDAHYGNGTDDLLLRHRKLIGKVSHATRYDGDFKDARGFFAALEVQITLIRHGAFGAVFYQAGADAWAKDPLGAGYLTKDELVKRDRLVFDACVASRTPCVWNFAGGYADQPTVRLHMETHLQADLACADQAFSQGLK